ncbi:MAG: NUDIX hydrolase [Chloroflexi bacterium]|nr:NUDIX hydrolase [Chloroflexota bacterium]
MTEGNKLNQIVAGIIRRGDEILLVEQQGRDDPASAWALPGGRVEPGELLTEALAREIREETGLAMRGITRLAYLAQHNNANPWQNLDDVITVFVFEIAGWDGEIRVNDPDRFILQARFVPVSEALRLLETTLLWRTMREPPIAYLRGEVNAGTMWFYRRQENGEDALVARIAAD